ncbi:hypothetical protein [Streptomyces sp. NPDC001880]
MTDQPLEDTTGPATLRMPQQAPPIDRTAAIPPGTDSETPGVEANILPMWWDNFGGQSPWRPGGPFIVS